MFEGAYKRPYEHCGSIEDENTEKTGDDNYKNLSHSCQHNFYSLRCLLNHIKLFSGDNLTFVSNMFG